MIVSGRMSLRRRVVEVRLPRPAVNKTAAALEKGSEHPLATAILAGAKERGVVDTPAASAFESITGKGIVGMVGGRKGGESRAFENGQGT